MKFSIGDKVACKIVGNSIVSANLQDYDAIVTFEIIGENNQEPKFALFIPKYFNIKFSWTIIEDHLEKCDIDPDFLDEKAVYVTEDKLIPTNQSTSDGLFCSKCKEFFPFAQPNQSDNTLKCYLCRTYPFR